MLVCCSLCRNTWEKVDELRKDKIEAQKEVKAKRAKGKGSYVAACT